MKLFFVSIFIIFNSFNLIGQTNWTSSVPTFNDYVPQIPIGAYYKVARRNAFFGLWDEIRHYNWDGYDKFETQYYSFLKRGIIYYNYNGPNYMVLQMNENHYLFKNVPFEIWNGLKAAYSKGTFYNTYIRGRYLIYSTE